MIEGVPGIIGGVFRTVGPVAAEGPLLVKIKAVGAGVGVHPVQHHPDAVGMGLGAQFCEVRFRAQHGVRGLVVAGIVAVAGKALGNGVQIENSHPKRGQIVHFRRNSLEISAVKVVVQHQALRRRLPADLLGPVGMDRVRLQFSRQVTRSHFAEPVGKRLIENGPLGPVRGLKIRRDAAELPLVPGLHVGIIPLLEKPEGAGGRGDVEIVKIPPRRVQRERPLVDIVGPPDLLEMQGRIQHMGPVLPIQQALDLGGLDGSRDMDVQGTFLAGGQGPEGGLVKKLLGIK